MPITHHGRLAAHRPIRYNLADIAVSFVLRSTPAPIAPVGLIVREQGCSPHRPGGWFRIHLSADPAGRPASLRW
jgi:hypothetical protein